MYGLMTPNKVINQLFKLQDADGTDAYNNKLNILLM